LNALLGFVLVLLPLTASAQVNKCLDSSGKVVGYASQCPPGTRVEQTGIRNSPATVTPPAGQKSLSEREADFRKRQMEQAETAKKAAQKTEEDSDRRRSCDSARSYLASLQAGNRITRADPATGERVFLEEKDLPGEIAAAQRTVAANCK